MMRVLSLFDGISCGQVALNRAGFKPSIYFASEVDRHAVAVTQRNWPATVQLGCVTNVEKLAQIGGFGHIDLLMGGSPCQGFSSAGPGDGFTHPQSRLFFNYVKTLKAVKPRYFLLENVKMKREWLDIITSYMGVEPTFINSADFSAQNRQRWYWTNIPIKPWFPVSTTLSDILHSDDEGGLHMYKLNRTPSRERMWLNGRGKGNAYACANITKAKKSYALVTDQDRFSNSGLIEYQDFCRYLTPIECERLQTLPDGYTHGYSRKARWKMTGNGWTVDVIAHILKGMGK